MGSNLINQKGTQNIWHIMSDFHINPSRSSGYFMYNKKILHSIMCVSVNLRTSNNFVPYTAFSDWFLKLICSMFTVQYKLNF